jgi:hypothetical protein
MSFQEFGCSVSIIEPAYVSTAIFGKITKLIEEDIKVDKDLIDTYGYYYREEKRAKNRRSVSGGGGG